MSTSWLEAGWMQTFTGRQFFPCSPVGDDVVIEDIAHALSLTCRYGGHVTRFYSVAEHCLLMSQAVAPEHALWALLHDATEAYVGDMVRPLKINMPEYRAVEDNLMAVIAERFGLDGVTMPAPVKEADNRILLNERAAVMGPSPHAWQVEDLDPLDVTVLGFASNVVEQLYLHRFHELTRENA